MSIWQGLAGLFRRAQPPPPAPEALGAYQIAKVLHALRADDPPVWAAIIAPAMARYGINTPRRAAAFLATAVHETGGLRRMEEALSYSAGRMVVVWPSRFTAATAGAYAHSPERLANKVYASRMGNGDEASGDGWKFRGAGLIQITGRANYAALAKAFGRGVDDAAAWVRTREGAAVSAAWWWSANGCNELADAGDVAGWRRRVNGGLVGLEDVQALYGMAIEAMG